MGIVFAFKNTLKGDFLERQVKNHAHLCSIIKMIFKNLNCENSYVKGNIKSSKYKRNDSIPKY